MKTATPQHAYIGSRTTRERNACGEGITVLRWDETQGSLDPVQVLGDLVNPSYLAINRRGDTLYTVHGDRSEVSALRVEAASGQLSLLNQANCEGRNPVHLALDPSERHLIVSNHLSGELAVLDVALDGALGTVRQRIPLPGEPGPHRKEQPHAKPHFNPFDASGRWVLVPDKGLDRVFSFRFEAGQLVPAHQPWVQAREGAGPRNLVFHPVLPMAYVVNELDSTLAAYAFDAQDGALCPLQIVPTLPDSFTGDNRAASIGIDASGSLLFVSNRGHDSVVMFSVDGRTGRLAFERAVPAQGRTPRFFTLSPGGRWLLVLNEDSNSIQSFAIDRERRDLVPGPQLACGSPVCLVFGGC